MILVRGLFGFARFWYGFIAGDQPLIAVAVAAGLVCTVLLSRTGVPSWWPLPFVTVLVLLLGAVTARRHRTT